jgi:hypothetical protein
MERNGYLQTAPSVVAAGDPVPLKTDESVVCHIVSLNRSNSALSFQNPGTGAWLYFSRPQSFQMPGTILPLILLTFFTIVPRDAVPAKSPTKSIEWQAAAGEPIRGALGVQRHRLFPGFIERDLANLAG